MKWRCLNDPFGYCSSTPEFEVQPSDTTINMGNTCKRDPKTCRKYQTLSDTLVGIELPKGSYRHIVVGKKKVKKGEK